MLKFNYKEREYSIANNWSDIKLGQWVTLRKTKRDEKESDLNWARKMIEICCNVEENTFNQMPIKQISELTKQLVFLGEELDLEGEADFPYKIGDVNYYPIDMMEITNEEYEICYESTRSGVEDYEWVPLIASVLLRPSEEKLMEDGTIKWTPKEYNKEDVIPRINLFNKELPIDVCIKLSNFFLNGIG